jgi:hypothetical protein
MLLLLLLLYCCCTQIYQSTPTIELKGEGFNPAGTQLRFMNALKGGGTNYTASAITKTSMTLSLEAGSLWRRNADNLPGPLVLLAADAGDGFVALGPTAVKSGRKIATVRCACVNYSRCNAVVPLLLCTVLLRSRCLQLRCFVLMTVSVYKSAACKCRSCCAC